MLVSLLTAYAVLAETLVVVAWSRGWHLSWWLWHLLMLAGFGFVAYSVRVQGRREGSSRALFAAVAQEETIRDIRDEHRRALGDLVDALHTHEGRAAADVAAHAANLGQRLELTDAQVEVLAGAAEATYEVDRLRRQLDALFHLYVSPDVAEALLADPERAELGGAVAEVTVLFADLRGYASFSEATDPVEVVEMLNRYFRRAVPVVLAEGGTVTQFTGDAIMAVFNAPKPLRDHAYHAARAGLALQRAVAEERRDHGAWPVFRVGIETGPALVGNVGGAVRSFTVIGDTPNVAARLEAAAEPGQVVLGPGAHHALGARALVADLGPLALKGKAEAVPAVTLLGLEEVAHVSGGRP